MATILDKDLTRESSVKVDNREILVSLNADQTISMKLKGMKSGTVSISIGDLYDQLKGNSVPEVKESKASLKHTNPDGPMLSLHDIRHRCNIKGFDYNTVVIFENMLTELLSEVED